MDDRRGRARANEESGKKLGWREACALIISYITILLNMLRAVVEEQMMRANITRSATYCHALLVTLHARMRNR